MQGFDNKRAREAGFTLIELLITIVVLGLLTAVAIIGVGGLNDRGQQAACRASLDAARASSTVHRSNTGAYPQNFDVMTNTSPPELEVAAGLTQSPLTLKKGTDWTLTLQPNGARNPTTYLCS